VEWLTFVVGIHKGKASIVRPDAGKTWLQSLVEEHEGCPESIQPFWISLEPIVWPWCNFATSQRRPYCASVNSHSSMGLVSRQWDAFHWACVTRDRRIHNDRARRSASLRQCACPLYSHVQAFGGGGKALHHPGLSAPLQPIFGSLRLLAFPKLKSPLKWRRFVNATATRYTSSSVNVGSLPTDYPHGRVTVHGWTVRSLLTGCQVTSRPRHGFSRYWKWLDIFRTALVSEIWYIC
jgi:hypothetical protein